MKLAFRTWLVSLFCNTHSDAVSPTQGCRTDAAKSTSHMPLSGLWTVTRRQRRADYLSNYSGANAATSPIKDEEDQMSEAVSARFHKMSEDVASRIEQVLEGYAAEHGRKFNAQAFRDTGADLKGMARDALSLGMDIWPVGCGEDGVEEDRGNVVRFPVVRKMLPSSRSMKAAMSTVGAIVGSTIIAAATTESVSLPGFLHVASFIYSKNTPPLSTRLVERNGRVSEMVFERRPGEPWDYVHLIEKRTLTPDEIADLPVSVAPAVEIAGTNG